MNTNKIQKSTSSEYKQHIHYPISLFVPVYVSWSIFVCTCVCILEYLLSKSRDICEVAREVIRDVATDITDVHREHWHKERNQVSDKLSTFNRHSRNTIRFSTFNLMDHLDYGRLRSESVDRSEPREGVWWVVCPVFESDIDLYLKPGQIFLAPQVL